MFLHILVVWRSVTLNIVSITKMGTDALILEKKTTQNRKLFTIPLKCIVALGGTR